MVCPPLIVTDAELDQIVGILVESLDAFAAADRPAREQERLRTEGKQ